MFDADKGKMAFDRLYRNILENENVGFWYEPWAGINELEAWARCITDREIAGAETDLVAYLTLCFNCDEVYPTDWFYDGVPYTLAVALHMRYLAEHEVKE